jgi:hypothetical protein
MRAVALPSIRVTDEPSLLRALEVYELERLDFAEAYLVALAEATGVGAIASFDRSRREHRAARAVNATVIAIAFRACDSEARIPAAARSRPIGQWLAESGRARRRQNASFDVTPRRLRRGVWSAHTRQAAAPAGDHFGCERAVPTAA